MTRDGTVSTNRLCKRYGSQEAVRNLTLTVDSGEIFGVIGPDGAGKTSLFQMLAGVLEPTSGEIRVGGLPAREARLGTGYLTQGFSLYPDLSVMENINYVGDLRLTPRREIAERARRYLSAFGMANFGDRAAGALSGGMKQKLSLICALVGEPRVLLLDEPTTGVDPVSRREFWDILVHLSSEGRTIVVATPYLDEAERCNRVAFMDAGEFTQLGKPADLRAGLHAKRIELQAADLRAAQEALRGIGGAAGIVDVQRYGDHLDILAGDPQRAKTEIAAAMQAAGTVAGAMRVDDPILENVFVAAMRAKRASVRHVAFPARDDHRSQRGQAAIDGAGLTKRFGSFTAVDDADVQIRYGEIYGLLGSNGAGKTTMIKMLCGLLEPTSGRVQLGGELRAHSARAHQHVGYMSQKFSLYDDLPIDENLEFFAAVYGLPPEERVRKIEWVLQFAGLQEMRHYVAGSLPGGWKQRIAFGSAIMHEPSILFLDEPTSGVDPLARRELWALVDELADAGAAVLVTTHYLDEAEQCNRLGFMASGRLVLEGSPSELKAKQSGHLLEFRVDAPQRAADLLRGGARRSRASLFGDRLHVIVDDVDAGRRSVEEQLSAKGIGVFDVREGRFSIEDVFIDAVERAEAPA